MRIYLGIILLALLMVSYSLVQGAYKNIILVPDGFYGTFTVYLEPKHNGWNFRKSPNYREELRALVYHLNDKQEVRVNPTKINLSANDVVVSYTSGGEIKEYRTHAYDKPMPEMVYDCKYTSKPYACIVGTPRKVCEFIFESTGISCRRLGQS